MHPYDTFTHALGGHVALPGSPEYERALKIDNGRVQLRPEYVVFPTTAEDISVTLAFAGAAGIPLTPKGGGHSATGYCLNQAGMVLDLSSMKAMRLDRVQRLLYVEMGATWKDVYSFLADSGSGLIPIGGGCLGVGLPGFLLGGGYSFLSRSYGLGSDNVAAIDLVTPDGVRHELSDESTSQADRDLFWASRGGGGGNFGVAASMTLRLHQPPTARLLGGQVTYPLAAARDVLGFYNTWVETLPDAMAVYGYIGNDPDPAEPTRKIPVLRLTPIFNGPYNAGIDLLRPLLGFDPIDFRALRMTLPQWELTMGSSTNVRDRKAYMRSGTLLKESMTAEVVDTLTEFMSPNRPSADSFLVWTHAGGQVERGTEAQGSYAHRDARFVWEVKAIWDDAADTRENVEWAYDFGEALRPSFSGAYLNYIDPLLTGWTDMYYGGNYDRLKAVKAAADPGRVLDFQQSLGSDFEPSDRRPLDLTPLNRTFAPR